MLVYSYINGGFQCCILLYNAVFQSYKLLLRRAKKVLSDDI